jgi:D-beta-D-heptose 7-phosphate kinase/D-beta-D-heptose 1-phosphate adenosyltransferase
MSNPLIDLLESSRSPRILVLGDVMLDRYVWCDVARISPEAPTAVLRTASQDERLGGAGNVAAMLRALDVPVALAAVVGNDDEGRKIAELLASIDVDARAVTIDAQRPSTLKQRFMGGAQMRHPQQMFRVDREATSCLAPEPAAQILARVEQLLPQVDLVLVSDYGKGVCDGEMISWLVDLARARGVAVVADPTAGVKYQRYAGCRCITPNRQAAAEAVGMAIAGPNDALEAARRLLRFGVQAAAITLDRDGIAWADRQGNVELFPVRPRQLCDVTGAGDAVMAALGYALALGADFRQAITLANLAGGLEVERQGVCPLTRQELLDELTRGGRGTTAKIVSLDELLSQLQRQRQSGRRIVMTNGCFDLLHPGHVASLEAARKQGDCLVVGLNSDRSVRALKGPERPMIDQQGRAEMVAALACVDYVVVFDDPSVAGLVGRVRPDVLVKAAEYSLTQIVGHEIIEQYGGRVVPVPMKPEYSTTRLIEKVRSAF